MIPQLFFIAKTAWSPIQCRSENEQQEPQRRAVKVLTFKSLQIVDENIQNTVERDCKIHMNKQQFIFYSNSLRDFMLYILTYTK